MATKQQIEKDNNTILEEVMEVLESTLDETPKKFYEYTLSSTGEKVVYLETREQHLQSTLEWLLEHLGEHNYFYDKVGIDKYSLGE